MNVIEDARNCINSNGGGIGSALRKGIPNVVHEFRVSLKGIERWRTAS